MKCIIFPYSFFNNSFFDAKLHKEFLAVSSLNLFDIILFDFDVFIKTNKLVLKYICNSIKKDEKINAIYRGFMLKPDAYKIFYDELLKQNIQLVNNYDEYCNLHIFKNAYNYIKDYTAKSLFFEKDEKIDIEKINLFDNIFIKDYVKTIKNKNFENKFSTKRSQKELDDFIKSFCEKRGELFCGGICIKEYVDLKKYNNKTNEYRVFYANKEVLSIERNGGQMDCLCSPSRKYIEKFNSLNSNFYTLDFVEIYNGDFYIMDTGDAQVSGLSDYQNYNQFYRNLYFVFK